MTAKAIPVTHTITIPQHIYDKHKSSILSDAFVESGKNLSMGNHQVYVDIIEGNNVAIEVGKLKQRLNEISDIEDVSVKHIQNTESVFDELKNALGQPQN